MTRITRTELMMEIAKLFAKRSTCNRKPGGVGALLVKENRIISTGYNGPPSGEPHCCHNGEDGPCERSVHAEANVIAFAAKMGISTIGSTLITTLSPCITCAKLLVNAGIKEVCFGEEYRDSTGIEYLERIGKKIVHYR